MPFKRIFILIIIIILFTSASNAWTGKVVSVAAGDTLTVLHNGKEVNVKLYGVETPNKAQAFGQKAKEFTSAFVSDTIVDVTVFETDRDGRSVGLVTVGSKNLNRTLVASGYAWVYDTDCKQSFCGDWKGIELQAKASKLGLWSDSSPMPPWNWHSGNKFIKSKTKSNKSRNPNLLGVGPTN